MLSKIGSFITSQSYVTHNWFVLELPRGMLSKIGSFVTS